MKVSLNTVKQYTTVDLGVDELVTKINVQLGSVEEVIDFGARYKDVVIVKVVECTGHPNADKLSVCKIDDGGIVADVLRDENGLVQVVCGAPNARAGIVAAWLPPKSTVPSSYDNKEPIVIDARELRGVISQGMLAAPDELAIGSGHDGILEIDPDEYIPNGVEIKPGTSFAKAYGLDDTIIDIENKMFTHRPDCFGQLGVAREIAGIQGKQFISPDWYLKFDGFPALQSQTLQLEVVNNAAEKVPRFMAVAIKDVTVKPSPLWLQCELVRLGSKSINNIVDVTNYVMLLTGQPLHAYDYDKLRGRTLGTRYASDGEKVALLNGKTYELTETDIVIIDGEGPVGLGGIMGGGNSEVSITTKNIVLECATFDMYTIRKTSMRHGLFTDAVTRFTKGQSSLQNPACLNLAIQSIFDTAGGEQASKVFDETSIGDERKTVTITPKFVNERLGLDLSPTQISDLLGNVEITADSPDDHDTYIEIYSPFWRTDIEMPEDIVEEVGRLYGFDKLRRELPERSMKPAPKNSTRELKQKIRNSLSRAGANEVLTYSFVHENTLKRSEQDVEQAFKLSNALSPDLQYYRMSVLPSLLDKVHMNVKAGYDEFALFEIGKGHNKKYHGDDDEGVPSELGYVDLVYTSKQPRGGAPYYQVRRIVEQLAKDLGFELKFSPISEQLDFPVTAPFDQQRSALITSEKGEFIGMIGELKQLVQKNFKLPAYSACLTLDLSGLEKASKASGVSYVPLSRYPSIAQDISLRGKAETPYGDIFSMVQNTLYAACDENILVRITPVSIYQAAGETDTKTTTLHIEFTHKDKTLTNDDINALIDGVVGEPSRNLGLERI